MFASWRHKKVVNSCRKFKSIKNDDHYIHRVTKTYKKLMKLIKTYSNMRETVFPLILYFSMIGFFLYD